MSLFQAILLGIIQGLTEFLPISSSAHLVLVPYLLGWSIPEQPAFIFNVLVQVGTLFAVIIYFWKDLLAILSGFVRALLRGRPFEDANARLGWYLILATIPAGVFGLTIKKYVEAAFASAAATAVLLLLTAGMLFLAERVSRRTRPTECFNGLDALWMGLFQAISIFPGVSRSGSTLSGGLLRNLDRPAAARFAFLMSIPVMSAAGLVESLDLINAPDLASQIPNVLAGTAAAAIVGYFAIRWLIGYLMRHSLKVFGVYCMVLSAVTLGVAYVR